MTNTFLQLDVWKKAHEAVLAVYQLTARFPIEERYCLSIQMRKAASSIPANIVEGYGRRAPKEKAHFYTISTGSAEELKYFLILARDLKYLKEIEGLYHLVEDVSRMLRRLVEATLRPLGHGTGEVRRRDERSP